MIPAEVDSESVGARKVWVTAASVTVEVMVDRACEPNDKTVCGHVSTMLTMNVTV